MTWKEEWEKTEKEVLNLYYRTGFTVFEMSMVLGVPYETVLRILEDYEVI